MENKMIPFFTSGSKKHDFSAILYIDQERKSEKDTLYLPGGESNPGLPRDRRGYSPLYYRGIDVRVGHSLGQTQIASIAF